MNITVYKSRIQVQNKNYKVQTTTKMPISGCMPFCSLSGIFLGRNILQNYTPSFYGIKNQKDAVVSENNTNNISKEIVELESLQLKKHFEFKKLISINENNKINPELLNLTIELLKADKKNNHSIATMYIVQAIKACITSNNTPDKKVINFILNEIKKFGNQNNNELNLGILLKFINHARDYNNNFDDSLAQYYPFIYSESNDTQVLNLIIEKSCVLNPKNNKYIFSKEKLENIKSIIPKYSLQSEHKRKYLDSFYHKNEFNKEIIEYYETLKNNNPINHDEFPILIDIINSCKNNDGTINKKVFSTVLSLLKKAYISNDVSAISRLAEKINDKNNNINENCYNEILEATKKFSPEIIAKVSDNLSPEIIENNCTEILNLYENAINKDYYQGNGNVIHTIDSFKLLINKAIRENSNKLDYEYIEKILKIAEYTQSIALAINIEESVGDISISSIKEFNKILNTAKANKTVLKSTHDNISNMTIENVFYERMGKILCALELIGTDTIINAFKLRLDKFIDFINIAASLKYFVDKEKLQLIFIPEKSQTFNNLLNELTVLKKELSTNLTKEQQIIKKQNTIKIQKLKSEINQLKQSLKTNTDEKSITKIKYSINQKTLELKNINYKTQQIYDSTHNKELLTKINNTQNKINNILRNKITDSEEAIKQVLIIHQLATIKDNDDLDKYIENIPQNTTEANEQQNKFIKEKIYKLYDIKSDAVKKHLNLDNNKYTINLLKNNVNNKLFKKTFTKFCNLLDNNNPTDKIFENLKENKMAKKLFEKYNINYKVWSTDDITPLNTFNIEFKTIEDENLYINNLTNDLTSGIINKLPHKETKKIFNKLKEMGYFIKKEPTINTFKIYKNDVPITFKDAGLIIKGIKEIINTEEYWTVQNSDKDKELMKQKFLDKVFDLRENEYESIKEFAKKGHSTLTIRKIPLNNIGHSLFLGNQSGCCTAIGSGTNSTSAISYIKNKLVSGLELIENNEPIGNTLCFIGDINGKASLVLDNIELIKYRYNDTVQNGFLDAAKELCNRLGQPDMPIYAGAYRHKVNLEDTYKVLEQTPVKLLGIKDKNLYLESITSDPEDNTYKVNLYQIR